MYVNMVNDFYSSHAILMFTFNLFFIKCIISLKRSKFQYSLTFTKGSLSTETATQRARYMLQPSKFPEIHRKYKGNKLPDSETDFEDKFN